ncbi:MAG: serine hydrolase domain-containing protein, partial [Bacteroidota bacterium]
MRNGYLLPLFLLASLLAQSQQSPLPSNPGLFHSDYQPPVFTDSNRAKKVAAAFPAVEKIYRDYARKNHFPGLAFGIVVDGQLVYSGSVGYTDLSQHQPVNSRSLFRIASMTKSFTALAILKLRDEGRLSLEDPVYRYIPEIQKMPALTADAPAITIRHLLSHSAGFPEDNPWGDRQLADSDDDLIQLIEKGISFSNVPGINYEYSNLGFALLGKIITKVSGKPYQQYITENILTPLGMSHTLWEYTRAPENLLAHGYRWLNEKW